jgi:hypothetical protein
MQSSPKSADETRILLSHIRHSVCKYDHSVMLPSGAFRVKYVEILTRKLVLLTRWSIFPRARIRLSFSLPVIKTFSLVVLCHRLAPCRTAATMALRLSSGKYVSRISEKGTHDLLADLYRPIANAMS